LILFFFFISGLLISVVINGLLLRFSRSLGIRNLNDVTIRWSNQSKPSLGGIGMYFAFLFSVIAYAVIFDSSDIFENSEMVGLLSASTLAFLIGIADDAYNTRPLLKLAGQIGCGVLLVVGGSVIALFHNYWLDAVITVIWIVVVMNSLNMLDNMDGITASVSVFILTAVLGGCCLFGLVNFNFPMNLLIISLIGALIGFLVFNVHPSKMFMGDTGSQFISLMVGFFAIKYLWNAPSNLELPSWSGLLLALGAFTPAAADTLSVVINRMKRGQSPMVGGKDHTTHHLVYMGLSDFKVWIVFVLLGLFSLGVTLIGMWQLSLGNHLLTLLVIPYFLIIFGWLYRITLRFPQR
jgi:UDP-GlcNAc:undecaprenyl-phosphate/decaprenyl-phosphate GlcNAc-1-phosphate transferase